MPNRRKKGRAGNNTSAHDKLLAAIRPKLDVAIHSEGGYDEVTQEEVNDFSDERDIPQELAHYIFDSGNGESSLIPHTMKEGEETNILNFSPNESQREFINAIARGECISEERFDIVYQESNGNVFDLMKEGISRWHTSPNRKERS